MNPYDLRHLKARVPIQRVLAAHGLLPGLRRSGDHTLSGPCPLHGGDNPTAFRVHLGRGLWHCFTSCGGGDTVDLVRRILGGDHAAAARHLLVLAQQPETTDVAGPPGPAPDQDPPAAAAFRPFRRALTLDPNVPFLQRDKRITATTAARFEAGCSDHSSFLRGTVAVRLHNLHGQPLGYCGRRLDPDDIARFGKWRFPRGFPKADVLFNAHRAAPHAGRGLVIVECPWAVMRLHQAGVPYAVALLGTTLSPTQAAWIARTDAALLLLDGDHPGRQAADAIAQRLAPHTRVRVHNLPDGSEPEELHDRELARIVADNLSSSLNPYPSAPLPTEAP
jgi:DNA primase